MPPTIFYGTFAWNYHFFRYFNEYNAGIFQVVQLNER